MKLFENISWLEWMVYITVVLFTISSVVANMLQGERGAATGALMKGVVCSVGFWLGSRALKKKT